MAHIVITTPKGKRFYIEIEENKANAYSLKPAKDKDLIQTLRDNEDEVITALFLSDCESRTGEEIGKDLGIAASLVRSWKHEFTVRKRTMMRDKYHTLKSVYGIDSIIGKESY